MQCNALDSVTCGGALCFDAEEASDSDSDFDVDSKSDANNSDGEGENKTKAVGCELTNSCHGSGDGVGKSSGGNNSACDSESKHDQHINNAGKAVDAAEEAAVDDEKSNHNAEGVADNEAEIVGKKVVYNNDDEGDDGTVETALDVTQDVSASEEDDDESAEVEPADVKIDLDDESVDAIINALDDEFAPRKDEDEVALCTNKDETEEEKDDVKSIDTNMTEDYSEENDCHAFTHVFQEETNLTPQQQQWNDKYTSLLKYYNKHGTSIIPLKVNTKPKHLLLRRWADKQRLAFLNDELSPIQIQKLVAVEFNFGQDIDELVAEKIEQERIEVEQKRAEARRLEEEAKAASIRKEENHLKKLRKRMNHKKKVEQMRSEAISVVVGN